MEPSLPTFSVTVLRDISGVSTVLFAYSGDPQNDDELRTLLAHAAQLAAIDRDRTHVDVVLGRVDVDRLTPELQALHDSTPHLSVSTQ
jgi:hypothetical protein